MAIISGDTPAITDFMLSNTDMQNTTTGLDITADDGVRRSPPSRDYTVPNSPRRSHLCDTFAEVLRRELADV